MDTTFHVQASKAYVISVIRAKGHAEILDAFEGTDAEAIAAIEADGRTYWSFGCPCPTPAGECPGHRHPSGRS